jgi:hypothetical protein
MYTLDFLFRHLTHDSTLRLQAAAFGVVGVVIEVLRPMFVISIQ